MTNKRKQPQSKSAAAASHAPSAARRRSTNGLLVAVAVVAALGIVGIVNYVVYWQYRGMSPQARSWVRYDLTSSRSYSLSEQSRGVIQGLSKEHRIVTMLGGDNAANDEAQRVRDEQHQRIRDMVDEYARASPMIDAQHIELGTDIQERAALLAEMDAMFAQDTIAIRQTLIDALSLLEQYTQQVDEIQATLEPITAEDLGLSALNAQRLAELQSVYLRLQRQAREIQRMRDAQLGSDWQQRLLSAGIADTAQTTGADLPDYVGLMKQLQQYYNDFVLVALVTTDEYAPRIRSGIRFDSSASDQSQFNAREANVTLANLKEQVSVSRRVREAEIQPFSLVSVPQRYESARQILDEVPCVLVTSGEDARLLPADLLFRGSGTQATADDSGVTNDLFVGEEQLTGALISIGLDPPPLIVFIRSNIGRRAISFTGVEETQLEGIYARAAQRLLNMDFEVTEWSDPINTDPPQPRSGQRVVWVTMPYFRPDSDRRESLDTRNKDRVAQHLADRLAQGDSAMVMLYANGDTDPQLQLDAPDSIAALLSGFGIDAQLYQSAVRLDSEDSDSGDRIYSNSFLVNRWPTSTVVGDSLTGIDTFFDFPIPLELSPTEGVVHQPIVELDASVMHVQQEAANRLTGAFTPEPDSGRETVLIGASATRGSARLITIGSVTWAMNEVVTTATLPDGTIDAGLADQPGARVAYPGNSDLFVNCICWLAHEDDLIAASPRTQDIRRIEPMSDATLRTYRIALGGGMPTVIFVAGLVVWQRRRRA